MSITQSDSGENSVPLRLCFWQSVQLDYLSNMERSFLQYLSLSCRAAMNSIIHYNLFYLPGHSPAPSPATTSRHSSLLSFQHLIIGKLSSDMEKHGGETMSAKVLIRRNHRHHKTRRTIPGRHNAAQETIIERNLPTQYRPITT